MVYLLVGVYDSATTICAKSFIIFIRVTVLAHSGLAADVFRAAVFH